MLLGGAAGSTQGIALSQRELNISKLLFDVVRQGRIEIVATEQEMLADGGTLKLQLAVHPASAHQAEVACTAADIAYQNQVAVFESVIGSLSVLAENARMGRSTASVDLWQSMHKKRLTVLPAE